MPYPLEEPPGETARQSVGSRRAKSAR